jgi:6-phosphogluconate dehydrogenase
MELGMVGLGRMGGNMAQRLLGGGHRVVAFDLQPEATRGVEGFGATGVASLGDLVQRLSPPRSVWTMLPAGDATEQVVSELGRLLDSGDTLIDGGNSYYKDSLRRGRELGER